MGRRRGEASGGSSSKREVCLGVNYCKPRWRDLGTWHKPHSVLHSSVLHIIMRPYRIVKFLKELETPSRAHPSATECRTKWLGLICQKPRLCLEDDK